MEVRHSVRYIRLHDDLSGRDLLLHKKEGRLVDGEDARGQLHGVVHAWRYAAEGTGRHHDRIQKRIEVCNIFGEFKVNK